MTTYTYKKLKEKYDLLEKESTKFKVDIDEFFADKVFTKLPFGEGKNQFLVEVMIGRADFQRILKYNAFIHAIKNAREATPEEIEQIKKEIEEDSEKKTKEVFEEKEEILSS